MRTQSLPLRGRGTALAVERVSKVGSDAYHGRYGEGSYKSLHSFANTILQLVTPYLRHPLSHASRASSPGGRAFYLHDFSYKI